MPVSKSYELITAEIGSTAQCDKYRHFYIYNGISYLYKQSILHQRATAATQHASMGMRAAYIHTSLRSLHV